MTRLSRQSARGRKPERLRALLPDVWALVKPRRGLLAVAFLLMAVSRVAGLVLPASTKYLIDDVIGRRQIELLLPLVGAVVAATVVQGLGSFALVQLVSKAAQKLIADMRIRVQEHVGRLPIAFHDANKTGDLVSRIMNDVEGFRNLVGTGLDRAGRGPAHRHAGLHRDAAPQPARHPPDPRRARRRSASSSSGASACCGRCSGSAGRCTPRSPAA